MAIPLEDAVYKAITTKHFYCRYRHQFIKSLLPEFPNLEEAKKDPNNREKIEGVESMFPEWEDFKPLPKWFKEGYARMFARVVEAKLKADLDPDRLDENDSKRLYDDFKANEITWVEADMLSEPRPVDQEKLEKAKEKYAEKLLQMIAGKSRKGVSAIVESLPFDYIVQNNILLDLATASGKRTVYNPESGEYITINGALEIKHTRRGLKPTTGAFLTYLLAQTTQEKTRAVTIDVQDFMKKRDLESYEAAKDMIKKEAAFLDDARLYFDYEENGKKTYYGDLHIFSGNITRCIDGRMTILWNVDFFGIIKKAPIMEFCEALLAADLHKFPNAIVIGLKLLFQRNLNLARAGEKILSTEKLLKDLPLPETENGKDRHFAQRIIEPIYKTLDHLCDIGVLKSWEYCGPKGRPLKETELARQDDFSTWKKLFIKFNLPDNERIAERRQLIKKRIAAEKKGQKRRIAAPKNGNGSEAKKSRGE